MRAPAGRGRHGADAEAGLEVRLHLRQLPPAEAHQVRGGAEEEGGGGVDVSHIKLLLHKESNLEFLQNFFHKVVSRTNKIDSVNV